MELNFKRNKRNIKKTNKFVTKTIFNYLNSLAFDEDVTGLEVDFNGKDGNLQKIDGIQYRKKQAILTIDYYEKEKENNE